MNRETIIQRMREIDLIDFRDEDEDEHVAELVEKVASIVAMAVAKEAESRKAAQLENADLKERLARSGIEQRRAVAKEREECGWQPIETAPKDGRLVLVYRPLAANTRDEPIAIKSLIGGDRFCWPHTVPKGSAPTNPTDGACHVTHWMPLPPPPSAIRARWEAV